MQLGFETVFDSFPADLEAMVIDAEGENFSEGLSLSEATGL